MELINHHLMVTTITNVSSYWKKQELLWKQKSLQFLTDISKIHNKMLVNQFILLTKKRANDAYYRSMRHLNSQNWIFL